MDREEQRERDRQHEEDRLLAEQNPPKPYDGSRCEIEWIDGIDGPRPNPVTYCPLGTKGCWLKHDGSDPIPAEVLAARIAANQAARKKDREHRQD